MGPEGSADVHDNIFEAAEAGPVHQTSVASPSGSGPFLHVDVPTHPLSHPAVQEVRIIHLHISSTVNRSVFKLTHKM